MLFLFFVTKHNEDFDFFSHRIFLATSRVSRKRKYFFLNLKPVIPRPLPFGKEDTLDVFPNVILSIFPQLLLALVWLFQLQYQSHSTDSSEHDVQWKCMKEKHQICNRFSTGGPAKRFKKLNYIMLI